MDVMIATMCGPIKPYQALALFKMTSSWEPSSKKKELTKIIHRIKDQSSTPVTQPLIKVIIMQFKSVKKQNSKPKGKKTKKTNKPKIRVKKTRSAGNTNLKDVASLDYK